MKESILVLMKLFLAWQKYEKDVDDEGLDKFDIEVYKFEYLFVEVTSSTS